MFPMRNNPAYATYPEALGARTTAPPPRRPDLGRLPGGGKPNVRSGEFIPPRNLHPRASRPGLQPSLEIVRQQIEKTEERIGFGSPEVAELFSVARNLNSLVLE
jgi:hypothetical protein